MIAIGFDIGTHRIAYGIPSTGIYDEIDFAGRYKGRRDHELRALQQWVAMRLVDYKSLAPFIERPFVSDGMARNQTTSLGMSETVGVIRAARDWQQPAVMVVPGTWKKELVGDGRATKEDAAKWLQKYEGSDFVAPESEDMTDAYCVGVYGQLVLEGAIQLPVKKPRRKRAKKEA